MSADRELLGLAAKAEGHMVDFDEISGLVFFDTKFSGLTWDPLHNDGDALRLSLNTNVRFEPSRIFNVVHASHWDGSQWAVVQESIGEDIFAATRRVIVRVAAEIGKAMP